VLRSSSALAAAFVALATAGCGSTTNTVHSAATSTNPSTEASTVTLRSKGHETAVPTKAQYIAQADAICRTLKSQQAPLKARVRALNGSSQNTPSAIKALAPLVHQSVRFSRAADAKLESLSKPTGERGTIEKLLAGYSEEARHATNFADALEHEERGAWEAAEKALAKTLGLDRSLAHGYGFKVCGNSE
jgi:hypothetical protein